MACQVSALSTNPESSAISSEPPFLQLSSSISNTPDSQDIQNAKNDIFPSSDAEIVDAIFQSLKNRKKLADAPIDAISLKSSKFKLSKGQILFLLNQASGILLKDETLVEVAGPVVICGDLHGQFDETLEIMDSMGHPPKTRYLFMGDYVDRGDRSIELICFLLAYKIKYPADFFLLRGNHETSEVNALDGFKDDCIALYDINLWEKFQDCFKCLPLAGLVGKKILCMHGGISDVFEKLDDLKKIIRPLDVPEIGLVGDLLWSDPLPDDVHSKGKEGCGFQFNVSRNTSVFFCRHAVENFLSQNNLDLIVRGHELYEDGYIFSVNKKVLTLFTAPYYFGGTNDAAVLCVEKDNSHYIQTFQFAAIPTKIDQPPFVDEKTRRESATAKISA